MAHLHRPRLMAHSTKDHVDLYGTVRGCFLVSPLASLKFTTPSYSRWFSADVLRRKVVHEWGVYFVENSPWQQEISSGDGWGMALDVPESWWEGFEVVDSVLITGGYEEIFSGHIQQLGKMFQRKIHANVTLNIANETHDGPLMDFAVGRGPSETTKAITDFVISCFKE